MATSLQYLPFDNLSLTNFKLWARGIGTALSGFGWTLDGTVNGTVNWNTIKVTPAIWYSITQQSTNLPTLGGPTIYQGAWSNAGVTYTANQGYVTYDGATWICTSGYTTNSSSPPPGNEPSASIHWVPWFIEIWKSAVTPTIYIRFEYGGSFNSLLNCPRIRITCGTSDDANANIGTGAGNQVSSVNDLIPTSNSGLVSSFGTQYPCYFSGDNGNRFSMLMWASIDQSSTGVVQASPGSPGTQGIGFFGIERSLTNTGAYYTTPSAGITPYWTAIWAGYNNTQFMQSFVNTTGSTWVKTTQDTRISTLSCDLNHGAYFMESWATGSGSAFQISTGQSIGRHSIPALPIFPLVGWVGNPLTVAMSYKVSGASLSLPTGGDAPNYNSFTQQLYGSTRTYFCVGNPSSFATFGSGSNNGLAMRFD